MNRSAVLILMHLVFIYWMTVSTPIGWLLVLSAYVLFAFIGKEIGLHRYLTHRSFKPHAWAEWLFIFLNVISGTGSSLQWVAIHRMHHQDEDGPTDPHSPQNSGWKVWFQTISEGQYKASYLKDLLRDKRHVFVHRNYNKLHIAWLFFVGMLSCSNWQWVVYLWAGPVVLSFHTFSAVNVIGHSQFGYRNYKTPGHSANNLWLNCLLLGMGLHNNHHGKQTSHTTQLSWYEIDLWGWLIEKVFRSSS